MERAYHYRGIVLVGWLLVLYVFVCFDEFYDFYALFFVSWVSWVIVLGPIRPVVFLLFSQFGCVSNVVFCYRDNRQPAGTEHEGIPAEGNHVGGFVERRLRYRNPWSLEPRKTYLSLLSRIEMFARHLR